jgi:hypothetical protein
MAQILIFELFLFRRTDRKTLAQERCGVVVSKAAQREAPRMAKIKMR